MEREFYCVSRLSYEGTKTWWQCRETHHTPDADLDELKVGGREVEMVNLSPVFHLRQSTKTIKRLEGGEGRLVTRLIKAMAVRSAIKPNHDAPRPSCQSA